MPLNREKETKCLDMTATRYAQVCTIRKKVNLGGIYDSDLVSTFPFPTLFILFYLEMN